MRRKQHRVFRYAVGLIGFYATSVATDVAFAGCFDFGKRIDHVLPLPTGIEVPTHGDTYKSGTKAKHRHWAIVKSDVEKPLETVLKNLVEHRSTKSARITEMKVDPVAGSANDLHQRVFNKVKPFPLVNVRWTEDWAFESLKGDWRSPQNVLVSYEKTDGTFYIQHLCGSILLKRIDPKTTMVFIYEESQATNRTEEDALNGLKGVVEKIRSE